MFKNTNIKNQKRHGFTILEVVVGVSLISLVLFSLVSVLNTAFRLMKQSTKSIQVAFLLEEGVEAIKIIRDSSWENIADLTPENTYFLNFSEHNWVATSTGIYIDEVFERSFIIENVYRDSGDDIVESGGTLDENTKKTTVYISWFNGKATTTKSISTYLTNFHSL